MKILITGHKGFVGKHLFEKLSNTHDCVGFDIVDGEQYNIANTMLFPRCDLIVHLAALAGVRESHQQPDLYWKYNVEGTRNIFIHAQRENAKVLYASSSSVNNWSSSPYATTKKVCELIAPENSLGMRFTTVYGKDSRPNMMYRMLVDNTAKYMTTHSRDFIHVDDVVSAIETLIKYNVTGIIDVGTGKPTDIVVLSQAAGRNLPIKEVTGEQTTSCADTKRLNNLGWQPTRNVLEDIVNDIV